jgi:ferredoxin
VTVRTDEGKCNGCGARIPESVEGALRIVDGRTRLDESRCDGLGARLRPCPQGAIALVEAAENEVIRGDGGTVAPPGVDACPGLAVGQFSPPGRRVGTRHDALPAKRSEPRARASRRQQEKLHAGT